MLARVQGAEFKVILNSLSTSRKTTVNICYDKTVNMLLLQTSSVNITNKILQVEVLELDNYSDITVEFTKIIELLHDDADVELHITPSYLEIKQGNFSYKASKVHEERVPDVDIDVTDSGVVATANWISNIMLAKSLSPVAKTLQEAPVGLQIFDGEMFTIYSNSILVSKCEMPNMVLTSESGNMLAKSLSRANNATYYFDSKKNALKVIVNPQEITFVPTQSVNVQNIKDVKDIIVNLEELTKVDFSTVASDLKVLTRVLKNQLVQLVVHEGSLGFTVNSGSHDFTVGTNDNIICSMSISIAQVNAIVKLFESDSNITILKGNNCLCLQSDKKKLMLAGMLF